MQWGVLREESYVGNEQRHILSHQISICRRRTSLGNARLPPALTTQPAESVPGIQLDSDVSER